MSIFGSIMSKIFHSAIAAVEGPPSAAPQAAGSAAPAASPTSSPSQPVDVEAVLTAMASEKGRWQLADLDC